MSQPDEPAVNAVEDRRQRKRQGIFYTPAPIARYMAASTLGLDHHRGRPLDKIRVIDPACGAGALLWAAYQWLCERQAAADAQACFKILRDQLFGVDLDLQALEKLRHAFRTDLGEYVSGTHLERVLARNFRCGNAILGDAWQISRTGSAAAEPAAFHWRREFPEICAAGGFDVVLANPPYRRERGAKTDLADLEHAPLADRWRRPRMDLWHYFFHRSLELLQPNGLLSFIVNSYWTTSHAGQPLIERLAEETTPLEIVNLGAAPVFPGVGGRHLILQLRQGVTQETCNILHLRESAYTEVGLPRLWTELLTSKDAGKSGTATNPFRQHRANRNELFHAGRIHLEPRTTDRERGPQSRLARPGRTLGELFEVRQGIAENPPRVTRQQTLERPEYQAGEGVFVLTTDELSQLNLSELEQACVRPYYSAAQIDRYWSPAPPTHWLLYLTRDTAADITNLPNIAQHLNRFRPLLERRRETQQGKIAWWHLHWPREARLFESPRILAVQMVKVPKFAYVEQATYVGFAVNLILSKPASPEIRPTDLTLPVLSAILNSSPASDWFDANAKRRGVNLDITGSTLKTFPLPELDPAAIERLADLWRTRWKLEQGSPNADRTPCIRVVEAEIDHLVRNAS